MLLRAADVAFNLRGNEVISSPPDTPQRSRFGRAVRLMRGQVARVEEALPNIRSYLTLAAV